MIYPYTLRDGRYTRARATLLQHFISVQPPPPPTIHGPFRKVTAGTGVVITRPVAPGLSAGEPDYSPEYILQQVSASKRTHAMDVPGFGPQTITPALRRHAHDDGEPENVPVQRRPPPAAVAAGATRIFQIRKAGYIACCGFLHYRRIAPRQTFVIPCAEYSDRMLMLAGKFPSDIMCCIRPEFLI